MSQRVFKGIWIPKELWFSKELSLTEKVLYLEIESLDNDFGCVATNKKLGEVTDIKPTTVSSLLKSLEQKGFISITYKDYKTFSGRSITISKLFYTPTSSTPPSNPIPPPSNHKGPPSNPIHSNTNSNTNSSNDEFSNSSALYKSLVEYWLKEFHVGWSFSAVQGKALKSLITKITKVLKHAGRDFTDYDVRDFFKAMCQHLPEWYKEKELNTIDSKFNEIISEIKSNNAQSKLTTKARDQGQQYRSV